MKKITRDCLLSLEDYAVQRDKIRQKVKSHKEKRIVKIGENVSLHFEDFFMMHYQVQEMLRAEKIFDAEGIQEEMDAYNPLIPDGTNLKATMMIQFSDVEERKKALSQLIGIERQTWVQVEGFDKVFPIANEDLERETEEKTSSVHFLRFEFSPEMITAATSGSAINMGVDHENYTVACKPIQQQIRDCLAGDFA